MLATHLFRLVPTARPDDPNWGRAACQGEVVVRARSAGEARALAAQAEARALGFASGSTTQVIASAFRDPRLYGVRREPEDSHAAAGPPGVLHARFVSPAAGLVMHDD